MPMPNFFLIGAQKCGTEALYRALRQHPDIYMSQNKEPFFFVMDGKLPDFRLPSPGYTQRLVYDWARYLQLFDGAAGRPAIGEASALYLSSYYPERTAERIHQRIPDAKIIAIVRQPADRAYSAFNYYHARDLEPLSDFAEALAAEPARIAANDLPDIRHRMNGFYYANLKPYFELFSRSQIRVYLHEEWNNNPVAVLQDIFHFLGVDATAQVEVGRYNVTHSHRSQRLRRFLLKPNRIGRWLDRKLPGSLLNWLEHWNQFKPPPLDPTLRRALTDGYREDILQLQALIGKDLTSWLADEQR